jgi:threonine synthase
METMDKTKQLTLNEEWLKRLQQDFRSASISDDEMCNAVREIYEYESYLVDPHSAVAIAAAKKLGCLCDNESSSSSSSSSSSRVNQKADNELTTLLQKKVALQKRVVIIATASPCKFEEAVTVALGKESWNKWKYNFFPPRAKRTMEMEEVEPFRYQWDHSQYSTLEEVQSVWTDKMINIVTTNFGE